MRRVAGKFAGASLIGSTASEGFDPVELARTLSARLARPIGREAQSAYSIMLDPPTDRHTIEYSCRRQSSAYWPN